MSESTLVIAAKRRKTTSIKKFQTFYHIAAMNHWKSVVTEQKNLLDSLGITPICGLLGSDSDLKWANDMGLNIQYHSTNLREYETPTLDLLYDWCLHNNDGAVLYMHTKGVSASEKNIAKTHWRWLMSDFVIKKYKDNLRILEVADIVGINWIDNPDYPHFSGNFWMSRSDWIINLKKPSQHKADKGPKFWNNPWERMHAEMWIGSKGHHLTESLCCRNINFMHDNTFFSKYK